MKQMGVDRNHRKMKMRLAWQYYGRSWWLRWWWGTKLWSRGGSFYDDEGNVTFWSPDYDDVEELIGLTLDDPDIGFKNFVSLLTNQFLVFYMFKFDKWILHKSWTQILKAYDMMKDGKENETKIVTNSWPDLPTHRLWHNMQIGTFFLSIYD